MTLPVSRRALLGGGIAIAVSWATWRVWPTSSGPPEEEAQMNSLERAVVSALLLAMFPVSVLNLDPRELGVVDEVERLLKEHFLPMQATALRLLLTTFELGTTIARGRNFSELSLDEAQEVLDVWSEPEKEVRRMGFDSIRVLLGMAYFNAPDVARALEYRAECGKGGA